MYIQLVSERRGQNGILQNTYVINEQGRKDTEQIERWEA